MHPQPSPVPRIAQDPPAPWVPLASMVLALVRQHRFPNLRAEGILPKRATGPDVDPREVAVALAFLIRCRRTKYPTVHTRDLQRHIGGVSVGAVIAAAVALGFQVCSWRGAREFFPHALIGVSKIDVRKRRGVSP